MLLLEFLPLTNYQEDYISLNNLLEEESSLALYIDLASRDYRNVIQFDAYVKTSLVNMGVGLVNFAYAINPPQIIHDGLKEYGYTIAQVNV